MTAPMKPTATQPIPVSDLIVVARFRAELKALAKLLDNGRTHREAMAIVWGDE